MTSINFLIQFDTIFFHQMKYNANRALGGLVNWTPSQFLDEEELESFVKNIASVLADQVAVGNDFKVNS